MSTESPFDDKKMPNFIGIGAPRSGSTWLYKLLSSHPDVWVPRKKREVQFFDVYFDRGKEWYSQFFPDKKSGYIAVGEVTPHYLYCTKKKIRYIRKEFPRIEKFIVILRDPIERLISHYLHRKRLEAFSLSLSSFIDRRPNVISKSKYSMHLKKWFNIYSENRFMVTKFENIVSRPESTKEEIASFLNINDENFDESVSQKTFNKSFRPRWPWLYAFATNCGRLVRHYDLYWIDHFARSLGIKDLLSVGSDANYDISEDMEIRLLREYRSDIVELERITGMDYSSWGRY